MTVAAALAAPQQAALVAAVLDAAGLDAPDDRGLARLGATTRKLAGGALAGAALGGVGGGRMEFAGLLAHAAGGPPLRARHALAWALLRASEAPAAPNGRPRALLALPGLCRFDAAAAGDGAQLRDLDVPGIFQALRAAEDEPAPLGPAVGAARTAPPLGAALALEAAVAALDAAPPAESGPLVLALERDEKGALNVGGKPLTYDASHGKQAALSHNNIQGRALLALAGAPGADPADLVFNKSARDRLSAALARVNLRFASEPGEPLRLEDLATGRAVSLKWRA